MKVIYIIFFSFFLNSCNSQFSYNIPERLENDWETTHVENVGINLDKINAFGAQINGGKYKDIHSILIIKDGKLVFEEYYNGFNKEKPHDIASVTKSITSALVGIAIDKGFIKNTSAPVWEFYKESKYENKWDSLKRSIRVKDLLSMRHGLDCDDFNTSSSGDFNALQESNDYVDYMLDVKMNHKVDQVNAYCTGSTQLLEPVLRKSTNYEVDNFASKFLFTLIGIKSFKWKKTPKGNPTMGMGAKMTPRDMARFGLLYLNDGIYNKKQIISKNWIKESLTPYGKLFGAIDYGYLWYIEPPVVINRKTINFYDAAGHGGQTIAIYPDLEMVVVITAGNYNNESNYYEMLENIYYQALIFKKLILVIK